VSAALLVLAGGAVGAPTRYLADRWISARHGVRFPFGTLAVNLVGCFVLGVLAGGMAHSGWSTDTYALIGTGFCGGLTTYSTFAVESVELAEQRMQWRAVLYLALSAAAGVGLAQLGWLLTTR
jgi:CrcB protein